MMRLDNNPDTLKSVDRPSTPLIQTRTVRSLEQEANRWPEGEKATPITASECPQNLELMER